ncbi:MAG: Ig-like domain-containing protein, partial [Candidatus Cloacimonas sp.]|nr:Ig-like domain-containing protein [Candidatus Cloacimonas sp.]
MMCSNRLHSIIYLIIALLLMCGCGSKRNPTGGPQDTEKPTVLGSFPAEYGSLANGLVEISFSKPMDKSSLANSIYIYPPVIAKKVSLDGVSLKIKLNETLKINTNYFITLSTRLKDTRGNPLDKNQTLVFRNGELSQYRIAGSISYETPSDKGLPLELTLLSADSLLVRSDRIRGESYAIEALNPQAHILRSYIDKNLNGRYDYGTEPFFEGMSDGSKLANLNMEMAYADSSKPQISRVIVNSNRELQINLSEPIRSYKAVVLLGKQPLAIAHQLLEGSKLSILCAALDSTDYTLQLLGAQDLKGNVSEYLEAKIRGKAKADTLAPAISFTNPRNGASVNTLSPILEIHFSEIIPADHIHAKLFAGSEEIPLKLLSTTGRIHRYQPAKELVNYRSHVLNILSTTSDFSGNKLEADYDLQFLPL